VHVLPFFHPIDGADAGFDPIDHTQVDGRLGTWDDVAALAGRTEVMADVIVNHVSRLSPRFIDFDRRGKDSPFAGMFLTYDRVFPDGASASDLLALHTPRPALPFTRHRAKHGEEVLLWTTFTSDQIDIDVSHPEGERYLADVLDRFQSAGIRVIRLDAAGYAVKKAGTSCFMLPETLAFIDGFAARARARGMEVLVEMHGHYEDHIELARRVDRVYDFALPPLVLHTLYARDATALTRWLDLRPTNVVTVLDTHDGIGVEEVGAARGDRERPGLLPPGAIDTLVDTMHRRSRGESRQASGSAAGNVDASQINCTFRDALGDDAAYLVARAIQCFVPGIPQIYYVGLFGGRNDLDLLRRTNVGRDVNRRYYTAGQLEQALTDPVVQALLRLLRLRNTHRAFGGSFRMLPAPTDRLALEWRHEDDAVRLDVDLALMTASVTSPGPEDGTVWHSAMGGA
jgi:sucrose phosphorylase